MANVQPCNSRNYGCFRFSCLRVVFDLWSKMFQNWYQKNAPNRYICLLDISNLPKVCFSRGLYRSVNIGHHLMSGKAACFSDPYNSTPVIFFYFGPSFKTTNQDQNNDVDGTRVCVSLSSQTITLFGEEITPVHVIFT